MVIIERSGGRPVRTPFTQDRLKQLLAYDRESGLFTWIKDQGGRILGKTAGGLSAFGYVRIRIDGHRYPAHRLAWLYVYGILPDVEIDHRDCDRTNNAIENLRLATRSQNTANVRLSGRNKVGLKGVSYRADIRRYRAVIKTNGTQKQLGHFETAEEAYAAYSAAAAEIFGEFARLA